ncbi:MAG: HNH endonuclease [Kofleriaceae bacterium]
MLRDGSVNESTNDFVWTATATPGPTTTDWREVDKALRGIGKRRATLDAEELVWIRKAQRIRIWRQVACVSLLDYLERRCGYAPRTARERIRVALALEALPGLTKALATGEQSFSAIRELTRVATPACEASWLARSKGKTVFEIQEMVAGHGKGSDPDDLPDPELRARDLRLEEIRPSTEAVLRQARQKAQAECGEALSDDAFYALLANAFLGHGDAPASEPRTRAKYQIAVTVCDRCKQGWQEAAGRQFAMDPADLARAECDAQRIGSLDAQKPARATQDISPKVRRFVWRRDRGRCVIPGCRSSAHLDLHHIIPRAQGGTSEPAQIILLCGAHHDARHRGQIAITGTAPDNLVITRMAIAGTAAPAQVTTRTASQKVAHVSQREADDRPGASRVARLDGPSALDRAALQVDARRALITLGFKAPEASAAVAAALAQVGHGATLEQVLREALRRCHKPSG